MQNPWAGHPYHSAYWRAFRGHRRGPSRLLWFLFGAGTATFWVKSHQAHEWHARNCWRDRIPQEAYPAPTAAPGQTEEMKREKDCRRGGWWGSRESWGPWQAAPPQVQQAQAQAQGAMGAPTAPAQPSPPTSHVLPPPMPGDRWEEERQRVQHLGKQATDTISELSEATLDSVLATVQSLKVKLAEARKEREQHLQQMQSLKDEQSKLFEEWRKQHESQQQQQQQQAPSQSPKPRYPVDFSPPS